MTTVYNEKFAFIHIPKCGGTSVSRWLHGMFGDLKTTQDHGYIGHIPVHDLPIVTGRPLDSFEMIFATVRNPYAQQVSQYEFWRKSAIGKDASNLHRSYKKALSTTFAEFVKSDDAQYRYINNHDCWGNMTPAQCGGVYPWWLTEDGSKFPDNLKVVRLGEAGDILPELISSFTDNITTLPHANRTEHRDWHEYYTPEIARTVESSFKWAFETCYEREAFYAQAI